jgi:hypothetical protein
VSCPAASFSARASEAFGEGFEDGFGLEDVEVEVGDLGIPSEIKVIMPKIPNLRIIHDIPVMIELKVPEIPAINVVFPKEAIPNEIKVLHDLPKTIDVVGKIPTTISFEAHNLPESIMVVAAPDFPTSIKLDASELPDKIQVVGIPSSIELVGDIPTKIELVMPDKPEVELVYKGAPIDVKIKLDIDKLTGEDGDMDCVRIVPCKPN